MPISSKNERDKFFNSKKQKTTRLIEQKVHILNFQNIDKMFGFASSNIVNATEYKKIMKMVQNRGFSKKNNYIPKLMNHILYSKSNYSLSCFNSV